MGIVKQPEMRHRFSGIQKHKDILTLSLIFLISMAWFWRKFSFSVFPGDNGDSRLSMMWMEHWYLSISHFKAPWNVPSFYPLTNSLSGSDGFFLQGMAHATLRFAGFSAPASFATSILLLHVVGSLSSIFLARIFKFRVLPASVVVALYGVMSPFWLCRNHVQLLLFPILGWVVYFGILASQSKERLRYLVISMFIFWCLLLSSGYAVAFAIFFLIIGFTTSLFFIRWNMALIKPEIRKWLRPLAISLIWSSPLILLFVRLYYWNDTFMGVHNPQEVLSLSPSFTDLISVPVGAGGIENNIPVMSNILKRINNLPNPAGEFGGALPLSTVALLLLFVVLYLFYGKKHKEVKRPKNVLFLNWVGVTLLFSFLVILKDFRNLNIWILTFYHLPLMGSIRVLSRFMLFASLLLPFVIALLMSGYLERRQSWARNCLSISCLIVLSLAQGTQNYGSFNLMDLKSTERVQTLVKQSCDSFYLIPATGEQASIPSYLPSGIATQIAVFSGVPTINGNSSFLPLGYSASLLIENNQDATEKALVSWIKSYRLSNVCLISLSMKSIAPSFIISRRISFDS